VVLALGLGAGHTGALLQLRSARCWNPKHSVQPAWLCLPALESACEWQHANEKTPVLTRCDLAHRSYCVSYTIFAELHWIARRETEKQAHSRCQWKMNTFIFTLKILLNGRKPSEIQLQNSEYYCRLDQTCHKHTVCKSKQTKTKKLRRKTNKQTNRNWIKYKYFKWARTHLHFGIRFHCEKNTELRKDNERKRKE